MRRDCLKIWNALLNCITAHHPIVADESDPELLPANFCVPVIPFFGEN